MKFYDVKAIISDLDGTLVWQNPAFLRITVGETLRQLGRPYDAEFAKKFWYGSDRDELITRTLGIPYMDFWERFWRVDTPEIRVAFMEVYPEVEVLRELQQTKGIRIGIDTNTQPRNAYAEIAEIQKRVPGIEFKSIFPNDPDDIIMHKPFGISVFVCQHQLGAKNTETIYIGDGYEDVLSAKKAGIPAVILRRNYNKEIDFGPDVTLIDSLQELKEMLA
jgi:phosphoglycolate phosphatase-like HAD superfamily hydrolase